MKIKDEWIVQAIETLKDVGIVDENGEYDTVFKGYLSSFGASIVQCGLLPSVLAFNKDDKVKIVEAVIRIINKCVPYKPDIKTDKDSLIQYCGSKVMHDSRLREISQAVAALKLGLRVYRPKTQSNDERS